MEESELRGLHFRVDKLERQNRQMRAVGLLVLLIVSAALTMGQVRSTKVIEATEIILRDASGKMRARLWFGGDVSPSPDSALFSLYAADEKQLVTLVASTQRRGGAVMLGQQGNPGAFLSADAESALMMLHPTGDNFGRINLLVKRRESGLTMSEIEGIHSGIYLADTALGPSLSLQDGQGFESQLGVPDTLTNANGAKRTGSAASLVMFGKDGKVIWSAPQ